MIEKRREQITLTIWTDSPENLGVRVMRNTIISLVRKMNHDKKGYHARITRIKVVDS